MGFFGLFKKKSAKNNVENKEQLVENRDQVLEKQQELEEEQQSTASANESFAENIESPTDIQTASPDELLENTDEENKAVHAQEDEKSVADVAEENTSVNENAEVTASTQGSAEDAVSTSSDGEEKISADSVQTEAPVKVKRSFFERLKRTRENISFGLEAMIKGKKISEELYEDLETALLTADLGVDTTERVIEQLRESSKLRELHDAGALKNNLKQILCDILRPCAIPLNVHKDGNTPYVILMVGVNGAGKTTTIGKLALKFKSQGLKVMLAAGDTFRAAAVEQLVKWGERTGVPVISQPTGSDSASVIFDALTAAKSRGCDVLICDTAGRLQNKDHLMDELKKIVRVMRKNDADVPDEVMLVLDGATGQNAVSQTKIFNEAVKVTGITITKLDGTAKGGVVFALADQFKIPLRFIGIGEKTEDLREFDVEAFVDALFGE